MLLDLETLIEKYSLDIQGCIHVGAHLAEEAPLYHKMGVPVFWIEADFGAYAKAFHVVEQYPDQLITIGLILDEERKNVPFNITNYDSMSSSIFEWGTHAQFSPDTVVVERTLRDSETLDSFKNEYHWMDVWEVANMLNIDIEGAGLLALKGATQLLEQIDYIYIEVQTENVYDGAPMLDEYLAFLSDFEMLELGIVDGQGWGDCFLRRKGL
jgi:FkbM family methyltransferase